MSFGRRVILFGVLSFLSNLWADGFSDGAWERSDNIRNNWDDNLMEQRTPITTETMNFIGINSPGEWNWWDLDADDVHYQFSREFWDPNIDYSVFERFSDREILDRQDMIRKDTRSCPSDDTEECRRWLAVPRRVEALPRKRGFTAPPMREQTFGTPEIQRLFHDREARRRALISDDWTPMLNDNIWAAHPDFQNCPFETEKECRIWLTKPIVRETMSNRNPKLVSMNKLITLARAGNRITPDMPAAGPLLSRYRALLASAHGCCRAGLVHSLRSAGASQGLIYKFFVDDANFYQFADRCLMVTDDELDNHLFDLAVAVADVRNTCLCRQRDYFETLLAPFIQIYEANPSFVDDEFIWSYRDGLNRHITVSINREVQAVMWQLRQCPDQ